MAGKIFVITGPSGVGKTSVAKKVLALKETLRKVITCTTRPPREGEVNNVDYRFFTEIAFEEMIEAGEMFEWARVYNRFYGSRKEDVQKLLDDEFDVLFVIDVQGAITMQKEHPEATIIFIEAESPEILLARLQKRDQGRTVNMTERLEALDVEMAFCSQCQHTVVNKEGEIEKAVANIVKIIDEA